MVRRAPIGHQSRTVAQACCLPQPAAATGSAFAVAPAAPPRCRGRVFRFAADFGATIGARLRVPKVAGSSVRLLPLKHTNQVAAGKRGSCGTRPHVVLTPIRPPLRDRKFADSLLEGDGFEPSVPREGPTRRDGFMRLSSGGSEAHHRRSAISTARSGRRSPPGPARRQADALQRVLAERRLTDARSPVPDRQDGFRSPQTAEAMAKSGRPAARRRLI